MPVIQSLLAGLPILLLHLGSATLVWLAALALYLWITPHDEFALIRAGNESAAISLGGAAIGLAVPLYLLTALAILAALKLIRGYALTGSVAVLVASFVFSMAWYWTILGPVLAFILAVLGVRMARHEARVRRATSGK